MDRMTRKQALAGVDEAIARTTGTDLEVLKAHRAKLVAAYQRDDAALSVKIAQRKRMSDEWIRGIDYSVR